MPFLDESLGPILANEYRVICDKLIGGDKLELVSDQKGNVAAL
jgi:hypothetical protein